MCWARAFGFAVPGQKNSRFGEPDGTSRKPVCFPYGTPSQEDQLLVSGINGVRASDTVSFFIQKSAGMPCIGAAEKRTGIPGRQASERGRPETASGKSGGRFARRKGAAGKFSGKAPKEIRRADRSCTPVSRGLSVFGRMRRDGECFPPASSLKLVRHAQLKSGDAVLVEAAAAQIAGHGFLFILGAGDHSVK